MKRLLSLATLSLCISGFAATQKQQAKDQSCATQPYKPLRNTIPLYETYDVSGIANVGVRTDLLYMNYTSPALTFASQQTLSGPGITTLNSTILSVPGDMSLGCNIALNYTMPNQPGYSFEFSWYYMDAHGSRSKTGDGVLLAHSVALTTGAPGSVKVKDHLIINFFDLMIQKDFAFGDWFNVKPAAGLMGGYMHSATRASTLASTATTFGSDTTVAALNQLVQFEGIGIKIGGHSAFRIWHGFRLTADLFYSVMYGYTKANMNYSSDGSFGAATLANAISNLRQHHGRALFDSMLGLAWESRFSNDAYYLDVHAGWRFQSFSDGWMEYEAEFNDAVRPLPLYGQGLQIGATFKF